jgi:hypothetical protein
MKEETKKELMAALVYAVCMLALAFGMIAARNAGYVDKDTVTRIVTAPIGLWMAWYGNRMPKTFVPNAKAREARRVAAWSQVASGLVYAGLFLFAPLSVAFIGGAAAVIAGIVVTVGYCLSLREKAKPTA